MWWDRLGKWLTPWVIEIAEETTRWAIIHTPATRQINPYDYNSLKRDEIN